MKRIRITQNRSDIAVSLRKAVLDTGASVSELIRDLDDTPSPVTDAFVFVTDADNVEIPAGVIGIVTVREARDTDPNPSEKGKAKASPSKKAAKKKAK